VVCPIVVCVKVFSEVVSMEVVVGVTEVVEE